MINSQNKLAIVIPYYKHNFFSETLQSVEKQTCKDFNLYIGNDASPYNPKDLIENILQNTPYEYYEFEENFGGKNLVSQWERVVEKTGNEEWFCILGDDDMISENFVEEFYKNIDDIEKNKSNVIRYKMQWINAQNVPTSPFTDYPELITPEAHLHFKLIEKKKSSLSEHIFRKSKYEKFRFKQFPLAWNSDDMAIYEFSDGNVIYSIKSAFVEVRVSEENISGRADLNKQKLESRMIFEKYLINHYYKNLYPETLKTLVSEHIFYLYKFNKKIGFNLLPIYWHLKEFKKIIMLPKFWIQMLYLPKKTK